MTAAGDCGICIKEESIHAHAEEFRHFLWDSLRTGKTKTEADYLSQIAALNKDKTALQDRITGLEKEKAALDAAAKKSEQDLNDRIPQLKSLFAKEIAAGEIEINRFRDVLVVSANDSVFFVPDWPTLLSGGEAVLQNLAEVFKKCRTG